jgi:hypothetical protein
MSHYGKARRITLRQFNSTVLLGNPSNERRPFSYVHYVSYSRIRVAFGRRHKEI